MYIVLPEVRKSSKQQSKTIKVTYVILIEQLIFNWSQLNPLHVSCEMTLYNNKA